MWYLRLFAASVAREARNIRGSDIGAQIEFIVGLFLVAA
jgi:hypothetical protein